MKRFRIGWAVLAAAFAVGGCNQGEKVDTSHPSEPQEVEYRFAPLDDIQATALSQFALTKMSDGVVPDVAMVVTPQPRDIPPGKLLVAVKYGECGHSLGRATIADDTLVVEKRPPKDGDRGTVCGGTDMSVGILVTLPPKTSVTTATVHAVA